LQEVLPEAVFETNDKLSVDYQAVAALAIAAAKELKAQNVELECRLANIEEYLRGGGYSFKM
jgi:hypothetical protein